MIKPYKYSIASPKAVNIFYLGFYDKGNRIIAEDLLCKIKGITPANDNIRVYVFNLFANHVSGNSILQLTV